MLALGTKLTAKKTEGIAEVIAIFPVGQAGYEESEYQIVYNGNKLKLKESVLDLFMEVLKDIPQPIEIAEPKKVIKKAVKKATTKKTTKKRR